MTRKFLMSAAACCGLAILPLRAETPLERGKYLVDNVGMCGDCHTPMAKGAPVESKHLKGSMLNMQPMQEVPGWRKAAPDITGGSPLFLRWKEDGMKKFLTTGVGPGGNPAGPPMPAYHFKTADADAVIAYLKSLR
jgi:mono/diheme cytochrome c family protein